jgi:hypothetical protein
LLPLPTPLLPLLVPRRKSFGGPLIIALKDEEGPRSVRVQMKVRIAWLRLDWSFMAWPLT